jgi:hypothetical protein
VCALRIAVMTGVSPAAVGVSNEEMMTGPVFVVVHEAGGAETHFSVLVLHQ